jgi:predicted MFS family arabinose efflux permease
MILAFVLSLDPMQASPAASADISPGMIRLLAIACGLIVANLYYAQTLVGPISAATGLTPGAAGLIVTLTQAGYCLGLLFIVPLGDLVENRRLVIAGLCVSAVALALAASTSSAMLFLAASLCIGLGSVAAQVLVPFAAHLSPEATRGQAVGKVVSGLLLGIMLARPAASLVADHFGWHTIFIGGAVAMAALALVLWRRLPARVPTGTLSYVSLLASMLHLLATTPALRRRAAYQAAMFGSFSLFWTTVPMVLAGPELQVSQTGIAVFALVGMAGAIASPIAGRLADQGHTRIATAVAMSLGVAAFALPLAVHAGRPLTIGVLALASILLDMGVAANLVLGQRTIFSLGEEVRSRLNGLYMAIFFLGGAFGSALGGWVYAAHGWRGVLVAGMLFPLVGLAYYLTELWGARRP